MAVNDLYQYTVKGARGENQFVNVFYYLALQMDLSATDLHAACATTVITNLLACVGTSYACDIIEIKNLFDPTDYSYTSCVGNNGSRTGTMMPNFCAASLQCIRKRTDMRHGWKRLGPITEEDVVGDGYTSTYEAILETACGVFGDTLQVDSVDAFRPVIVKRIFTGIVNNRRQYRLPENVSELVTYTALDWVVRPPTTQNTRKIGRGS